jgi:hypothetical protein
MKARGKAKNLPSSLATETERHGGFSNEPGGFRLAVKAIKAVGLKGDFEFVTEIAPNKLVTPNASNQNLARPFLSTLGKSTR